MATVEACSDDIGGGGGTNYLNCRASDPSGHTVEYPVPPGEDAMVNYTVTTQMAMGRCTRCSSRVTP